MMAFLIAAIIVFALIQRHRCRSIYRPNQYDKWSRKWERRQARAEACGTSHCNWDKWTRQWQDWETWSHGARRQAAGFEQTIANTLHDVDANIRRTAEKYARDSAASHPSAAHGEPQFKSEEERKAYQRARRRASQEAGFYVHLMWYGIVIGSCLIVNLLVTPFFDWWIFPAVGWGVGLVSHFGAVYGWRWIHDRVFEPAVQREVEREVTIEKEVLRTEKQASLDELTATFAHEIRNPIAAAKSLVQQMGEDPTSNENVEYAKVALDELARVERSVSHLLKYAKEEDYSFENVSLVSVLDNALTQMRGKLEAAQISVSRNYIGGPTIRADADKLRQVFTNVIDNAIDAMESKTGERRLEIGIRTLYPGTATVIIRDTGCGIPEDKLTKIFNPFYTTKQNGTGLGMGVAKKVMDAHRGLIEVRSQVGVGTEFSLSIPVADAARAWAENENHRTAGDSESSETQPPRTSTAPESHDSRSPIDGSPAAAMEHR